MGKKKKQRERLQAAGENTSGSTARQEPKHFLSFSLAIAVIAFFITVLYSRKTPDYTFTVRFYALALITGLLLLVLGFRRYEISPRSIPLYHRIAFALGLGYLGWSMISLFQAINYTETVFSLSHYFLMLTLTYLFTHIIKKEALLWPILPKTFVWIGILHAVVGLTQHYGVGIWSELSGTQKIRGLMANPNLYGSAQAFCLPFILYVLYTGSKLWRLFAGLGVVAILISLGLAETRSAWVAAYMGAFIAILLLAGFVRKNTPKWALALIFITGMGGVIFYLVGNLPAQSLTSPPAKVAAALTKESTPAAEPPDQKDIDVAARFKFWKKTLAMIKDHPVTGIGPGNWRIVVREYDLGINSWASGRVVPDRPHNDYLQVAAETGIPGAVLYFGFWMMVLGLGWIYLSRPHADHHTKIKIIFLLAGMAGFMSDCFFSFPTERMEHSLYLSILLGSLLGLTAGTEGAVRRIPARMTWGMVWVLLPFIGFISYLAKTKYDFEYYVARANTLKKKEQYAASLENALKAKNTLVTLDLKSADPAELYTAIGYKETKQLDLARKEAEAGLRYHPYNTQLYNTLGTVYTDMRKFDTAILIYQKALRYAPNYNVVKANLAINYYQVGKYQACIEVINSMDLRGFKGSDFIASVRNKAQYQLDRQRVPPPVAAPVK